MSQPQPLRRLDSVLDWICYDSPTPGWEASRRCDDFIFNASADVQSAVAADVTRLWQQAVNANSDLANAWPADGNTGMQINKMKYKRNQLSATPDWVARGQVVPAGNVKRLTDWSLLLWLAIPGGGCTD